MFRAKTYVNRKGEQKLQLSGDARELEALVGGDKQLMAEFRKAINDALEKATWPTEPKA